MKLSDNTLEENQSEAQQNVPSTRAITLNPEASVFKLPTKSKEDENEQIHPFMNGDVGKQSCVDHNPMSESCGDHVTAQNNIADHTMELSLDMEPLGEPLGESTQEPTVVGAVAVEDEVENQMVKGGEDSINGDLVKDSKTEDSAIEIDPQQQYSGNDDTGQGSNEPLLKLPNADRGDGANNAKLLTRDEIKEIVIQRVEYFFSRENWSVDRYLLSQMDSDQYVPVFILANCTQFKSVTKDHTIILDALKESSYVQLDLENNRVRPNYQRCIVILREISQLTPIEEIEAMFTGEGCPKAVSCEFIHNDVWYVTFESDNDAQKAYRYLRETVKTFNDKPILARIKTKPASKSNCVSVLRSYNGGKPPGDQREPIPAVAAPGANPAPVAPLGHSTPAMPGDPNPPPPPNPYTANPRMFFPTNNMNPSNFSYNYPTPQVAAPAAATTAYFYANPMIPWSQPNYYDFSQFVAFNGLSPRQTFKPSTSSRYNNTNSAAGGNNRSNGNLGASGEALLEEPANGPSINGSIVANVNNVPPPPSQPPFTTHSSSQGQVHHSAITHRNSFNNEPHINNAPVRDSQPSQRQNMSRGGRRRTVRRDDESNGHTSGNNSNSGRGSTRNSNQNNQDSQAKAHHVEARKHFELQATSFPPLPAAEEAPAAVIVEEKIVEPVSQTAWSITETHKFSDIMKGTAKQKTNAGASADRDIPEVIPEQVVVSVTATSEPTITKTVSTNSNTKVIPTSININKTVSSVMSSVKCAPSTMANVRASVSIGNNSVVKAVSSSTGSNTTTNIVKSSSGSNVTRAVTSITTTTSSNSIVKTVSVSNIDSKVAATASINSKVISSSSCTNNSVSCAANTKSMQLSSSTATSQSVCCSSISNSQDTTAAVVITTNSSKSIPSEMTSSASSFTTITSACNRHDKGVNNRDSRSLREDRRPLPSRRDFGGMGRGNLRRDGNFRMSGNKENRPQQKSWKEQRPDDEGWITKGARETRNNRDHRPSAHSFYENKNVVKSAHPMVNGDSSPPPFPKSEVESKPTTTVAVNKVATNNSRNVNDKTTTKDETLIRENDKSTNNNDGEHKTSWAKMALASKDKMERLSAEIKEKEEQERIKKSRTVRPISKSTNERPVGGRERENKPFKPSFPVKDISDRPPREFRGPPDNRNINYRQRDSMRSKSPSGK